MSKRDTVMMPEYAGYFVWEKGLKHPIPAKGRLGMNSTAEWKAQDFVKSPAHRRTMAPFVE